VAHGLNSVQKLISLIVGLNVVINSPPLFFPSPFSQTNQKNQTREKKGKKGEKKKGGGKKKKKGKKREKRGIFIYPILQLKTNN